MKYLVMYLCLSIFSSAMANSDLEAKKRSKFQVFQANPNSDISKLKMPKNYLKDIPKSKKLVNRKYRDRFLTKHLEKESMNWDELERDLFVRRLNSYGQKNFLIKYQGFTVKRYLFLKKEWNPDV